MKKLILLVAAAGLLIATPSCKKGANDPVSLKSRKARLAGEYIVDSWLNEYSYTDSDGDKTETTVEITGSNGTTTQVYSEVGESSITTIRTIKVDKATYSFTKDGTWESVMNTTTTWTESGDGVFIDNLNYTSVVTMTESGNWSFLSGQVDEFKNRERVILSTLSTERTSQTTTVINYEDGTNDSDVGTTATFTSKYDQGESSIVFEIDMLKKKEMVFKSSSNGGGTSSSDGSSTVYSTTSTGKMEITLSE